MIPTRTLRERMTEAIAVQLQAFGMTPGKGMVDCLTVAAIEAIGDPCLIRTADSLEPTFTLRAQDRVAEKAAMTWIAETATNGISPAVKLNGAIDFVKACRVWPTRKWPD